MNRQRTTIAVTKQEANENKRELSNKPKVTPSFLQKSEPYEEQYRHIDTRQRANIYNTKRQLDTRHNTVDIHKQTIIRTNMRAQNDA